MKMNLWNKLKKSGKPIFVMAPMANVTDSVFRSLFAKYGKPDVTWTEFVSADGLCSPAGKKMLLRDLAFSPKERPIVAQLFTGHPLAMFGAAKLVAKLDFDGLDINMGCPDRAVEKQGGGSAMIRNPKNAIAVLDAARSGWVAGMMAETMVGDCAENDMSSNCKSFAIESIKMANMRKSFAKDLQLEEVDILKGSASARLSNNANKIPVTVKTRLGYNSVDWEWLRLLLEQNLPALTVHLRTRKEMSDVPAHWELMPEIIKLRDEVQNDVPKNERTLIIGNGDVESMEQAHEYANKYSCDGIMIGRGIFGKPWFFGNSKLKTPEERLKIMLEHAKLFAKTYNGKSKYNHKNFAIMKKHFKAYVSGWPATGEREGAKELRVKLMEVENVEQVEKIVKEYLKKL